MVFIESVIFVEIWLVEEDGVLRPHGRLRADGPHRKDSLHLKDLRHTASLRVPRARPPYPRGEASTSRTSEAAICDARAGERAALHFAREKFKTLASSAAAAVVILLFARVRRIRSLCGEYCAEQACSHDASRVVTRRREGSRTGQECREVLIMVV